MLNALISVPTAPGVILPLQNARPENNVDKPAIPTWPVPNTILPNANLANITNAYPLANVSNIALEIKIVSMPICA